MRTISWFMWSTHFWIAAEWNEERTENKKKSTKYESQLVKLAVARSKPQWEPNKTKHNINNDRPFIEHFKNWFFRFFCVTSLAHLFSFVYSATHLLITHMKRVWRRTTVHHCSVDTQKYENVLAKSPRRCHSILQCVQRSNEFPYKRNKWQSLTLALVCRCIRSSALAHTRATKSGGDLVLSLSFALFTFNKWVW